jgi:hypothetical protein
MVDLTDEELLAALGATIEPTKARTYSPQEERVIAGFEDIERFFEQHGRAPVHGEERDIFERLYAVRLDRLRELDECRTLLEPLDKHGLLNASLEAERTAPEQLDDDALLAELGVDSEVDDDITKLRHVQSREERRAAEEIANRERCEDFDQFKPLFDQLEEELATKVRETRPFVKDAGFLKADITKGQFFILGGQVAYVAEVGDTFRAPNGEFDARLRVIYSNGTESNILRRSLQRALYKDEAGRRITEPSAGPLFGFEEEDGDIESGTIYVLRSLSNHPFVAEHRNLIHKIGVTGGSVEARFANAEKHATYLLAGVEVIATYKLVDINRKRLEALIHKVFRSAILDLTIPDRFGNPVQPREWFLVPLHVIDEAVGKIRDGSIVNFVYDPNTASLEHVE